MRQVLNFAKQCGNGVKRAVKKYMYNACIVRVNDNYEMYIPMWGGTPVFIERNKTA